MEEKNPNGKKEKATALQEPKLELRFSHLRKFSECTKRRSVTDVTSECCRRWLQLGRLRENWLLHEHARSAVAEVIRGGLAADAGAAVYP